eukprot:2381043-Ditylum_brightwellii.AAC.1
MNVAWAQKCQQQYYNDFLKEAPWVRRDKGREGYVERRSDITRTRQKCNLSRPDLECSQHL